MNNNNPATHDTQSAIKANYTQVRPVQGRVQHPSGNPKAPRKESSHILRTVLLSFLALAFVIGVGFGGYYLAHRNLMYITINGQRTEVANNATVASALASTNTEQPAGRLLAVDGSVLDETGGKPATYRVNGKPASEQTNLFPNDSLFVENGEDTTEKTVEKELPKTTIVEDDGSWGSVHKVIEYDPYATYQAKVGSISEKLVEEAPAESFQTALLTRYNIITGEKICALTFDDGPWDETTSQILDILRENNAKATFFVIGNRFDGNSAMTDLVKREIQEGHQVCTHSYSHAAGEGEGRDLGLMSKEAQIDEIVHGQECIEAATGMPASKILRAPGGNYSTETAAVLLPYVSYEIGWNIDTNDWRTPGAQAIEEEILAVQPGGIILMHDGGGDRGQTVEALRNALPKLKKDGWNFVTIDELLNYQ